MLKPKGQSFHYDMIGHWERNCPDFLSETKQAGLIESLVFEVSFANGTLDSWCVDSRATNYICNS